MERAAKRLAHVSQDEMAQPRKRSHFSGTPSTPRRVSRGNPTRGSGRANSGGLTMLDILMGAAAWVFLLLVIFEGEQR